MKRTARRASSQNEGKGSSARVITHISVAHNLNNKYEKYR
jgi:hypothetical protein